MIDLSKPLKSNITLVKPNTSSSPEMVFGTYIPLFSTGVVTRKSFYKAAGLATSGSWKNINTKWQQTVIIETPEEPEMTIEDVMNYFNN